VRTALLAIAAGMLALCAAGCGTGGLAKQGSVSQGQQLFIANCGSCHTLAHAGTKGTIGPNLDSAFQVYRDEDFKESTILEIVDKQIKYPNTKPSTGAVGMPANIVTGNDVDAVASYVACAAGLSPKKAQAAGCGQSGGGAPAGGGGGAASGGKGLFDSSGCGSCHTMKAASSTGTVGPNLDQSHLTEAQEVQQITNGGKVMPPFKGKLTPDQISTLAKWVVENRGK
jgi:mono/diheme cytochrome c family protein